jgi:CheY-like chemotaxis protein
VREKLRVVHVEDNPADVELMARALHEAGYDVDWQRVETEDEFRRALDSTPDVIIADYHLPRFTGLRALELFRQRSDGISDVVLIDIRCRTEAATAERFAIP